MIAGGYDDFQEEGSYEFANMKATSNAEDEIAHGRTPREMSRPTTTTRNGFMESHGAGIHILMQAKLAVEMGVPIRGIIAMTSTATDKEGRSVPAPGKGIHYFTSFANYRCLDRRTRSTIEIPLSIVGHQVSQTSTRFPPQTDQGMDRVRVYLSPRRNCCDEIKSTRPRYGFIHA